MIPHSAGFSLILGLTLISSLHAAYLTGDGRDNAWIQTGPGKEHKKVRPAGSLLWSSQASRANMDTTTPPVVTHGDTGHPSLTNLLVTSPYPTSKVQGKVFKAPAYTSSPTQRRLQMRLSDAWVFRESNANARRSDDTGLKQKSDTDLMTTQQDGRRMVEEPTRRPPHLGTNSSRGKHLYLFI